MTELELAKLFEKHNDAELLRFKRIENPPSVAKDLCAFLLLDRLCPGNTDIVAAAEHDVIYLSYDFSDLKDCITEDDVIYLLRCGVCLDNDTDSLCMYV